MVTGSIHHTTFTTHFPTYDGNGNISEYVSEAGEVVAHYEYDAFGRQHDAAPTFGKEDSFAHRFSTKPKESFGEFYYYGYRFYDAGLGRWLNRDPIGERGGVNLYGFVGNDGVNSWDLLGLFSGGGGGYIPYPGNPNYPNSGSLVSDSHNNAVDIGLAWTGSVAANIGGITGGIELSNALTFATLWKYGSWCVTVTITHKVGVGIGELTTGPGIAGSIGEKNMVQEGSAYMEGFGGAISIPDTPLNTSAGVSFNEQGLSISGDPLGVGFGPAVNFYKSYSYSGKVCEEVEGWCPTDHFKAIKKVLKRFKEAFQMARNQL